MKKILCLVLTCVTLLSACMIGVSSDYFVPSLPFDDVKKGAWYYEAISVCYSAQIVKGMSDSKFEPAGTLTRAQFVQILAMLSDEKIDGYKNKNSGFDDVKKGHWYNAAVCWAVEKDLVKGLSETTFGPNDPITREQLARLFCLFVGSQGIDVSKGADLSVYEDGKKVSKWAYAEMQWAVSAGIIKGTSDTTLEPRALATRAQACQMILNLLEFFMIGDEESDPGNNDYSEYAFVGVWTREADHDTETIRFGEDGSFGYSCACGNPVNDADLCEGYTYDDDTKTITLDCIEETDEMVTVIKVVKCDENELHLDFDGEVRVFYSKGSSGTEDDNSESTFVGVWTREADHDTETIRFGEDGSFSYSCACGNPVNDADLCEGYTYDDDTKTITLDCIEETDEMVTTIKIVKCDGNSLQLDFDGEIRIFEK